MNKVILIGRATKDLELRSTDRGTKCVSFDIACDNGKDKEGNKRPADFVKCVAWENQAEVLHKYLKKGDLINIVGSFKTDKYQNETGENRYRTYVLVREFEFIQSKPKDNYMPQEPDYIKENQNKTDSEIIAEVVNGTNDPFQDFSNEIQLSPDDLPF